MADNRLKWPLFFYSLGLLLGLASCGPDPLTPPGYREPSGYWTISMNESVFAMPSEESDLFPFVSVLKEQIEGRDLHASPRLRGPVRDVKNCLAILFQWKRKGQKRGLLVGRGDFPAGFDLETQLQDKQ